MYLKKIIKKLSSLVKKFYYLTLQNTLPSPNIETLISNSIEVIKNGIPKTKVLYIALKYDYGEPSRGLSYEEYNFYYTLKNMKDIEIIRFDYYSICDQYGKNIANNMIKEVALLEGVNKILLLLYKDSFDHNMFLDISNNYPIETILWLFDDDKRYDETKKLADNFNTIVTTIGMRHKQRIERELNSKLAQFAANHYLYKDFNLQKKYDVTFVGQKFGNRQMYVDYLIKNGVNIKAFGRGWNNGRLTQTQMIEIFNQSKIVLNFSSSAGNPHLKFLKGRIFEIPTTGTFFLTEECEELDDYFDVGHELERFTTKEEMLEKINYFLTNDKLREEIAKNGKKRVLRDYTFERYLSEILY